jgi:hypothetical protein
MLSNRAPVFQTRLIQMLHGSSQAVILFARSGINSNLSSSSVLVHTKAAMSPPALVPVITRGRRPASRKALTTPTWSTNQIRLKPIQKWPRHTVAKWSPSRETQCRSTCKRSGTEYKKWANACLGLCSRSWKISSFRLRIIPTTREWTRGPSLIQWSMLGMV